MFEFAGLQLRVEEALQLASAHHHRLFRRRRSRRRDTSLDEIATYFTAVDTAATVNKLIRLGWTLEDYENWVVKILTLLLDPVFLASSTAARSDR